MRLTEVEEKQKAVISSIDAGRELSSRLSAMGLIPGAEITMSKNAGRGPLIILIKDSKVALGRGMAEKVFVESIRDN